MNPPLVDDVPSPCISVCRMDPSLGPDALCEGCLRTIDEIIAWGSATADDKRAILVAVAARRRERPPA